MRRLTNQRHGNFVLCLIGLLVVAPACGSSGRQVESAPPVETSTTIVQTSVSVETTTTVPATQAPTTTTPSGPTLCIRSNIDFAALRSTPDLRAELLAEIPPGSCDVVLLEFETVSGNGFEWVHVRWNGIDGYTSASNAQSLPQPPAPTTTEFKQDVTDPEFILDQILLWGNVEFGELTFSDPTCSAAYWPTSDLEIGFGNDLDGAIAGLSSLSIPISKELRDHLERLDAIYRELRDSIWRIQNALLRETALADPAYDTVAAAFLELYTKFPDRYAASDLIYDACEQYAQYD